MTRGGPATLWVGTYPAPGPGPDGTDGPGRTDGSGGADGPDGSGGPDDPQEGVWRVELDRRTGRLSGSLAVRTPSPSFVAVGPGSPSTDGAPMLFAVDERADGAVVALTVGDDGALAPTGRVRSGGGSPCHLLVHPDGRALYVSNYASGTVGVLTLGPDGRFSDEVRAHGGPVQVLAGSGSGPVADRQAGPHAHSSTLAPGGEQLLVADLGTDELRRYRVRADGRLAEPGVAARLPAGTGPRHLAVGPAGHLYVAGELSGTVHVLAWDPRTATAELLHTRPACTTSPVPGASVHPAHPELAGDLLLTVRGPDVVTRFTVLDGGARLEHDVDHPLPGAVPRHLTVVPSHPDPRTSTHGQRGRSGTRPWVVVALQGSDRVVALAPDGSVADELAVPAPACVVPS